MRAGITGRQPSEQVPDGVSDTTATLDDKLTTVIEELAFVAKIVDRPELLKTLRLAYQSEAHIEGRIFAIVGVLKSSHAIRDLPSDQWLIALLRRVLT